MAIPWKDSSSQELRVLDDDVFYCIKESDSEFVLEDKTRQGFETKERVVDEKIGAMADMGIIRDADGAGYKIPIRWFFPKSEFMHDSIRAHADVLDKRYRELRELACPE